MAKLILFNKPFRVLSQFTDASGRATLRNYIAETDVYAAGRLDYDSEGLLLLTDDGVLQSRITDPRNRYGKTYLAQVDGTINDDALAQLRAGPTLADGPTRPTRARRAEVPTLWPREPPIRERREQTTSWIEVELREGRNRQVRRMCAAVGFPVLRLIRTRIGDWSLGALQPGESRSEVVNLPEQKRGSAKLRAPQRTTQRRKNRRPSRSDSKR